MPFDDNVRGLSITPRITLPSDPEFVDLSLPSPQDVRKRIAWISDSSSVIYKPGAKFLDFSTMKDNRLLPVKTLEILNSSVSDSYGIDLYLRLSLRSLESYTLSALALEKRPDVVVLTLNPFFVFNNHALFKGESHFARASAVWARDPHTWPWMLLFTSPGDHLWSVFISRFKVFSAAPAFAHDVAAVKKIFWDGLFPKLKLETQQEDAIPRSEENLKENSMIFWVVQRYLQGDISKLVNERNEAINSKWYRQLIRRTNFSSESLNYIILVSILEKLKANRVKALLYLAPVSENLRQDPDAWAQYESVKSTLRTLAQHYGDDALRIITDIPPADLKGTVFVKDDDVHLEADGDLDQFLAREIIQLTSPSKDLTDAAGP